MNRATHLSDRGAFARLGAVLPALLLLVHGAGAEDLRDVIPNLYGGDGIVLEPTAVPVNHSPHFTISSIQGLEDLNRVLASSLAVFSLNSAATGFTFDLERGVPVRTTEFLGPLLSERADTIGVNRLNVAFSYTRLDFEQFEGDDLDDLTLPFLHQDVNADGILGSTPSFSSDIETDFVKVDLDLELEQDVWALFATYGLSRSWDVGIVVPWVRTELHANALASIGRRASVSELAHNFGPSSDPVRSSGGGSATGLGDVILRTKYNFLRDREGWPDLAVLGHVKFETGDEDDLLGTGETDFLVNLIASRRGERFAGHLNLGYQVTTGPSELDELRYAAGIETRVHPRVTLATDVLGRWRPDGDVGDHLVDLSTGVKWNATGSWILSANVLFPLNRNHGLRTDFTWTLGMEYTFGVLE